jgi:NB-ARC domain
VDGVGGVRKTTLLTLIAHDPRVRRKFRYILFVALGKGATEAKFVSDIADLVQASGGGALAAKIRAAPAGNEKVQKVANLTRHWLAKTSFLLLDNLCLRTGNPSWAAELCSLASNVDSAVLLLTRDEGIAEHADPTKNTFLLGF